MSFSITRKYSEITAEHYINCTKNGEKFPRHVKVIGNHGTLILFALFGCQQKAAARPLRAGTRLAGTRRSQFSLNAPSIRQIKNKK